MKSTAKMTKAELIAVINQLTNDNDALRHQVSELHGRLDIARRAYKDLRAELMAARAELMAARAEQPKAEQPKAETFGPKGERPIATMFDLKAAGEYITELKRRGAKAILTARRDPSGNGFIVWAKARV